MKITGAEYICRIIKKLGAQPMFAYPGGAVLPIYDALPKSGLTHVLVRHEQGAALAANAVGRITGKPGFCLSLA